MNEYESVLLFDPNLDDGKLDELLEKLSKFICKNKGEVLETDKWGKRPLAYAINDFTRAHYVLLTFRSEPQDIKPLERQYKLSEPLIRCLTTRRQFPYSPTPPAPAAAPQEEA